MTFSVGMHSLLLAILIGGAAFSSRPKDDDLVLLNMIPANILDHSGVGGGSPQAVAPQPPPPQPAPPQAQPQPPPQPQPAPPPKPARQETRPEIVRAPEPKRRELPPKEITREEPTPTEHGIEPPPKPKRKPHEVQVDYTPASSEIHKPQKQKKTDEAQAAAAEQAEAARAASRAAERAAAQRQRQIKAALDTLASGVEAKAAEHAVTDNEGEGGPSFADYRTVVGNVYYRAWITPDNAVNRLAQTKAKITVDRNGRIISAEIVQPCGESGVDRSVERALHAVSSLPPFPAESHDQQRTFFIMFDLKAKEEAG